jgi:hypothetical protein
MPNRSVLIYLDMHCGERGSIVGWGTMLQAGRSPVQVPDEVDFLNLPNLSIRAMALGSIQPLTEMSTRNLPGGVTSDRRVELTTLPPSVSRISENMGASNSRNPKGLHGLYRDNVTPFLYLFMYCKCKSTSRIALTCSLTELSPSREAAIWAASFYPAVHWI